MSKLEVQKLDLNEAKDAIKHLLGESKAFVFGPNGNGGVEMREVPSGVTPDQLIEYMNANQPKELTEEQKADIKSIEDQTNAFANTIDQAMSIYTDEYDTKGKSSAPYFIRENDEEAMIKMPEIVFNGNQVTEFTGSVCMPLQSTTMNMVGANTFISGLDEDGLPKNTSRNSCIFNTRIIMNNFQYTATTMLDSIGATIMQTLKDMLSKHFGSTSNIEYLFHKNMKWNFEKGGIHSILCNLRNYVDSRQWAYCSQEPLCESIVNNNTINQISALYANNVLNYILESKWETKDEEYGIYDDFTNAITFKYMKDIQSFVLESFHELARIAMVHISLISSINGVLPMSNPLPGINDKEKKGRPMISEMNFEF